MGYSQRLFDLAKFVAGAAVVMALPSGIKQRRASCPSRASACSCASTTTCRSTRRRSKITDDARIRATLPTLKHLIERGARIVLGIAPRPSRRSGQARVLARAGRGAARRAARASTSRSPTSRSATARARSSAICATARSRCSRTCASTRARRRTTRRSRARSRRTATSTSTTRSAPRTARTRRPRAW